MDQVVAHQRAQNVFSGVLANVQPSQMDAPTPCEEWAVRDLIEHLIGGNERVPIRAGLRSQAAPRPADLREAHRVTAVAAQAVFAGPGGMTRIFELPIGPVPGSAFIRMRTTDALIHAWDLAKATGQPTDLDQELAAYQLAASLQHVTGAVRGPGKFFGEVKPCDQDRPPADQLAAFLGRSVR